MTVYWSACLASIAFTWFATHVKHNKERLSYWLLVTFEDYEHIYHVFVIRCDRRDEIEKYLKDNGIGTVKHYPVPMHLLKAYEELHIQ